MKAIKSFSLLAGLTLAFAAACATPPEPAQSAKAPRLPPPDADNQYRVIFPDPGHGMARYIGIDIGADLAKSCGLMRSNFEFDSAEPLPQDKIALRAMAECLERPELQGAELSIVGRADSRGSNDYNLELGRRRAERVKKLFVEAGVRPERIRVSSSGKMGAVGDDTLYSYGYDRRVDTVLVGVVHAPR